MTKKKKPKSENKTDWAFTPKLGYEIEPELNESEEGEDGTKPSTNRS